MHAGGTSMTDRQRRRPAAVVTGGGGGIGTAVALELARRDVAVVAMDPGVGLQGEPLGEPTAEETARRITAEGGVAGASSASVTDPGAVRALFAEGAGEFGGLGTVVSTARILRLGPFLAGAQNDWHARGRLVSRADLSRPRPPPPRLIEAVRTADTADFAASLDTLMPVVLGPAEERQRSTGGSNARFGPVFDQPGTTGPVAGPASRRCLVVADNAALVGALAPALGRCCMTVIHVGFSS